MAVTDILVRKYCEVESVKSLMRMDERRVPLQQRFAVAMYALLKRSRVRAIFCHMRFCMVIHRRHMAGTLRSWNAGDLLRDGTRKS